MASIAFILASKGSLVVLLLLASSTTRRSEITCIMPYLMPSKRIKHSKT